MAKCLLCNSSKQDDACFGEFLIKDTFAVHEFCLYLSSGLVQNGRLSQGLFGFLLNDIKQESQRVKNLICCYCKKGHANIGCCGIKCRRTFHLICGLKNGVENQFTETFRSYCEKHVRIDKESRKPPSHNELCCICYERILTPGKHNPYTSRIRAPCCKNGWFHRNCLQGYARSAGYFFRCPLCNDTDKFLSRITYLGIFLRFSDASWELEPNAFEELLQRPNICEADNCRNKIGRTAVDDEDNPFVYCVTCGSVAFHKKCLPNGKQNFDCKECQQIVENFPSTSEADSGSESIQVEDDENEVVEICHICDPDGDNDADDEDDEKVDSTFRKNTPSVEPHASFQYDDNEDNTSGNSSQQSNESANFRKLKRKREIPLEFGDESDDDGSQILKNNSPAQTDCDDDDDDEEDPICFLGRMMDSRGIIHGLERGTNAVISSRQVAQETATKTVRNDINNVLQSKDENIQQSENNKRNSLDISCIANRTRRRSILRPSLQQQRTTFDKSPITSASSTSTYGRSDKNKRTQSNIGDISCVGHRTRRRVSLQYSRKQLSSIGEVSDSESNDSYRTPLNNNNYHNKRRNEANMAITLSSSSSTASSSYSHSIRENNKRLRSISSSDEEFNQAIP